MDPLYFNQGSGQPYSEGNGKHKPFDELAKPYFGSSFDSSFYSDSHSTFDNQSQTDWGSKYSSSLYLPNNGNNGNNVNNHTNGHNHNLNTNSNTNSNSNTNDKNNSHNNNSNNNNNNNNSNNKNNSKLGDNRMSGQLHQQNQQTHYQEQYQAKQQSQQQSQQQSHQQSQQQLKHQSQQSIHSHLPSLDSYCPVKCKLADFYDSKPKVITLCRNVYCQGCDGTGIERGSSNNNSNNNNNGGNNSGGSMSNNDSTNEKGNLSIIANANYRNGRNMNGMFGIKCHECNGVGYHRQFKKFELYLQGLKHGDFITFRNEGDHWWPHLNAGNVILTLKQVPHKVFQRKNQNLFLKKTISLKCALSAANEGIFFQHIDGRIIRMKLPFGDGNENDIIKPFDIKCVKFEGMPFDIATQHIDGPAHYDGSMIEMPCNPDLLQRGHLFVQFNVQFPNSLPVNLTQSLKPLLPDEGTTNWDKEMAMRFGQECTLGDDSTDGISIGSSINIGNQNQNQSQTGNETHKHSNSNVTCVQMIDIRFPDKDWRDMSQNQIKSRFWVGSPSNNSINSNSNDNSNSGSKHGNSGHNGKNGNNGNYVQSKHNGGNDSECKIKASETSANTIGADILSTVTSQSSNQATNETNSNRKTSFDSHIGIAGVGSPQKKRRKIGNNGNMNNNNNINNINNNMNTMNIMNSMNNMIDHRDGRHEYEFLTLPALSSSK